MENYKIKEDSELVKLTRIWVKVLICFTTTLILTIGIYYGYRTYRVGKAIERGHDPVIARLAFDHGTCERIIYLNNNKQLLQSSPKIKKQKNP